MAIVQILINTGDFKEYKLNYPSNFTKCGFGIWLYSEGLILSPFASYQKIELIHQKIHDYYLQIYNLFDIKFKGNLFKSTKKLLDIRNKKNKFNLDNFERAINKVF